MIGYIVLLFILFIFSYLFFAPFYFEINTIRGLYRLRFHLIASIGLRTVNGELMAEIKIAGWSKKIDLFERKGTSKEKPLKHEKSRKKGKKEIPWKKINGVLSSFKVNRCEVTIDTGDLQINAMLYPFFYLTSVYSRKNIRINFTGENEIILEIENSLARMSWAFIRS